MTIEHKVPRNARAGLDDTYSNCFLACRYCNEARQARPARDRLGRSLLDPVSAAWGAHFAMEGDRLVPTVRDEDAAYTHLAYDLNDERKVRKRQRRRERIPIALELVRDGPRLGARVLDMAAGSRVTRRQRQALLTAARHLHEQVGAARIELSRYRLVPDDADPACRCRTAHAVPHFLNAQAIEVMTE